MQRKQIFPLFFLFLLLSVLATSSFPQVKAVSYYNWIRNSSFEVNVNLIEDSGFESGAFNSGLVYGNWSGDAVVSTTILHAGVYSCFVDNNKYVWYNLTDAVLGADVTEFTFWDRVTIGSQTFTLKIYYSDLTYDSHNWQSQFESWVQRDVISYVNDAKYVVAFQISCAQMYGVYVDDFALRVYDTDSPNSQNSIDRGTSPWSLNIPAGMSYDGLTNSFAHIGDYSYIWVENYNFPLLQQVNLLSSDAVHYVDCWILAYGNASLNVWAFYSDGGSTAKEILVSANANWQHINFGKNWIESGRIITKFMIYVNDISDAILIDDVGLWASVPLGLGRVDWYVIPSPISGYGAWTCSLYAGVNYQFYGVLYDADGGNTENGTFTVVHSLGVGYGNVSLGKFNFTIVARSSSTTGESGTGWLRSEPFGFTVELGEQVIVFNVIVNWYSGAYVVPPTEEGEIGYDTWYSNMVVTYMVLFIFLIVPPLIIAFEFSKHNVDPFMGFIGGLCLTVPIAYMIHIIDLWVLFVFVLGLILMVLSKLGAFSRF